MASVAVPQYQKAVAKARLAGFVTQAYAVRNALRMYQLANGTAATGLSDLDIWDSLINKTQNTFQKGYIGNREFVNEGGHYIRTGVSLPGFRAFHCEFHWAGNYGFCYTYTSEGEALVKSLGWELIPGYGSSRPYYIGKKTDWK